MADKLFKKSLAISYAEGYRTFTEAYGNSYGTIDNSIFSLSVQFLNRDFLVQEIVDNHHYFENICCSIESMLLSALGIRIKKNEKKERSEKDVLMNEGGRMVRRRVGSTTMGVSTMGVSYPRGGGPSGSNSGDNNNNNSGSSNNNNGTSNDTDMVSGVCEVSEGYHVVCRMKREDLLVQSERLLKSPILTHRRYNPMFSDLKVKGTYIANR